MLPINPAPSAIQVVAVVEGRKQLRASLLVMLALSLLGLGCVEHPCPGPGKTAQSFHEDYMACMDGRPIVQGRGLVSNRASVIKHCMLAKGHVLQRSWCDPDETTVSSTPQFEATATTIPDWRAES